MEGGQSIQVPAETVALREDGVYAVALSFREIMNGHIDSTHSLSNEEPLRIPVIAEEIVVEKRMVDTGRVRITKKQQEYEETVDEPLIREEVEIERIAINQMVEGALPAIRDEGDTLIIPVFEEVLVIERRIRLKEELHIHRKREIVHEPQQVLLRREEVTVERLAPLSKEEDADPSRTQIFKLDDSI